MKYNPILIGYLTVARKECTRFLRIWKQTILPPVITTSLYFIIFGTFIGSQIAPIGDFTYIQFIVPGLIMMSVITNAFSNVASSFYGDKFQGCIEEMLTSPLPNWIIIAGFITGGVLRGILVGIAVLLVSLLFSPFTIAQPLFVFIFIIFSSVLFSLGGLFNGMFAKSFDDISIIPTFVLTPLTYLGGVFYSIQLLPDMWQKVSYANPVLYLVNGFRYGFLGVTDVPMTASLGVLFGFFIVMLGTVLIFFNKKLGTR